jgi:hypothetical protein
MCAQSWGSNFAPSIINTRPPSENIQERLCPLSNVPFGRPMAPKYNAPRGRPNEFKMFQPGHMGNSAVWNKTWEAQLPVSPTSVTRTIRFNYAEYLQAVLTHYPMPFRDVCGVQRDLAVKVGLFAEVKFHSTWASEATRSKHMLTGHVRASAFLKSDDSRKHSVDTTLDSLEKGNGGGFLSLLKAYTLQGSSRYPYIPLSFPFPDIKNYSLPQTLKSQRFGECMS